MPRVLIAADESDVSVEAARVAHALFGDTAEYLLINVGITIDSTQFAWGEAAAIAMPMAIYPPSLAGDDDERIDEASHHAADIASDAHIDAEAVGAVGDPADAILAAARQHAVDVIVVASHERSWFDRLLRPSVTQELLREARVPILVVK